MKGNDLHLIHRWTSHFITMKTPPNSNTASYLKSKLQFLGTDEGKTQT
jgi:hypothetical protein